MGMNQKIRDTIIGGIFAAVVLFIGMSSFYKNRNQIFNHIKEINVSNVNQTVDSLEDTYKNGIVQRNGYINLYGAVQNVLGKSMIGNFEYIKDKQGVIHKFIDGPLANTEDFVNDMKTISSIAGTKKIRTVYVQNPYLTITEDSGIDVYVNEIAGGGHRVI